MTGIIMDEENIIEYSVEPLLLSPQEYSISYTLSGQPVQYVLPRYFSKSQAMDRDFVEERILEHVSE